MDRPQSDLVFISNSHKDKDWLEKLQTVLKPLIRKGVINVWDDTRIQAGQKWREEIKAATVDRMEAPKPLAFSIENTDHPVRRHPPLPDPGTPEEPEAFGSANAAQTTRSILTDILPGSWPNSSQIAFPGAAGQMRLELLPNGFFRGNWMTPMGMTTAGTGCCPLRNVQIVFRSPKPISSSSPLPAPGDTLEEVGRSAPCTALRSRRIAPRRGIPCWIDCAAGRQPVPGPD